MERSIVRGLYMEDLLPNQENPNSLEESGLTP